MRDIIKMKKNGFYIIKDKFFTDAVDPYLKINKRETRPLNADKYAYGKRN